MLEQARLAQSVEHQTFNLRVAGSSPSSGEHVSFFLPYTTLKCIFLFLHSKYFVLNWLELVNHGKLLKEKILGKNWKVFPY